MSQPILKRCPYNYVIYSKHCQYIFDYNLFDEIEKIIKNTN